MTGECRKSRSEKPHDMYCSSNIVRLIKWRRLRWAGHVASIADSSDACRVSGGGNMKGTAYFVDLGIEGRIILKSIFWK